MFPFTQAKAKKTSEIVRVDSISKFTHVVAHGLVEKIAFSPVNRTKTIAFVRLFSPLDCCPVLEIHVILIICFKSYENYSKNTQDWYIQLFFDGNKEVEESEDKSATNKTKADTSPSTSNSICHECFGLRSSISQ